MRGYAWKDVIARDRAHNTLQTGATQSCVGAAVHGFASPLTWYPLPEVSATLVGQAVSAMRTAARSKKQHAATMSRRGNRWAAK